MNNSDYKRIVDAKRNEIKAKKLDKFYGQVNDSNVKTQISNEYKKPIPTAAEEELTLIYALEATKEPKYVKLAKFLDSIRMMDKLQEEKLKTLAVLEDKENKTTGKKSDLKAIVKEFKEIEKQKKSMDSKRSRKLRKYKEVKDFLRHRSTIVKRLKNSGLLNGYSSDRLTEFFNSCPELEFLDNIKLPKKIR